MSRASARCPRQLPLNAPAPVVYFQRLYLTVERSSARKTSDLDVIQPVLHCLDKKSKIENFEKFSKISFSCWLVPRYCPGKLPSKENAKTLFFQFLYQGATPA